MQFSPSIRTGPQSTSSILEVWSSSSRITPKALNSFKTTFAFISHNDHQGPVMTSRCQRLPHTELLQSSSTPLQTPPPESPETRHISQGSDLRRGTQASEPSHTLYRRVSGAVGKERGWLTGAHEAASYLEAAHVSGIPGILQAVLVAFQEELEEESKARGRRNRQQKGELRFLKSEVIWAGNGTVCPQLGTKSQERGPDSVLSTGARQAGTKLVERFLAG